ncbi:MAG: metallopeptidase family protein [Sphingobium sp.]|nr:metallopeptidase family protein [Sphingobium sp.]
MIAVPDADAMEQIARQAIAAMPELFRQHLDGVSVHVEEFADSETLGDLGIESRWGLLGVYQGRPLTEQSVWDSGMLSPRIRLFRRPLLAEWSQTGEDLHDLIVHVLVHEVGHHFGYSDEEMEAIDEGDD